MEAWPLSSWSEISVAPASKRCEATVCRQLLRRLGFAERIRGSRHIFTKEGVEEILNLQPKGRQAKPYQLRQVRRVILKYRLGGSANVS